MADVLFTHSYFLRFDPKEERRMTPYPPLGTITAAAYLRSRGFRVALHDVMFSRSEDELTPAIERHQPHLLVIYDDGFNYLSKMCLTRMREGAFRMAAIASRANVPVVICSSDAGDHVAEYAAHGVDAVIVGEGEVTLSEVTRRVLAGDRRLDDIDGVAFVRDGKVVRTRPRAVVKDLDALPIAAWDLVDIGRYKDAWMRRHGRFSLNISTTRGCPFHCNWCAKPIYGQTYQSRSPEHVVSEMKRLQDLASPDHLWITDDIFGLKPGWVRRFAEEVERQGVRMPFKCLSRADLLLADETILHMKRAGCETVWIGAESGSQRVLDAMEKGTTIAQIEQATSLMRGHGIRVGFFLQFGYPGERWDEITSTLSLVRRCTPDEIGVSVSYPLPGTPFYERVREQMVRKQNWVDSADLDMMFAGAYAPSFYRRLHTVVHKRFAFWRGLRLLANLRTGPRPALRRVLRTLTSMVYHTLTLPPHLILLRRERSSPTPHATAEPRPQLARS